MKRGRGLLFGPFLFLMLPDHVAVGSQVVHLTLPGTPPVERRTIGGLTREAFVFPATGAVVLDLSLSEAGHRLVFEYAVGGSLERDLTGARIQVSGPEGKSVAELPLDASVERCNRIWRRAVIPLPETGGLGKVILTPKDLPPGSKAEILLRHPRLVDRDILRRRFANILLVIDDTLRRDHVGYTGTGKASTPAMDRLAKGAAVFRRAFTPIPITQPAHFSMLTGLYPAETGLVNNRMDPSDQLLTLPGLLQGYGYRTGAVVSIGTLMEKWGGLGRGFDVYYDTEIFSRPEGPEVAAAWGARDTGEPYFLLVNFDNPHTPRTPPDDTPLLRVVLNGEDQTDVAVSDYATKKVPLLLSPGENRVEFVALPDRTLPEDLAEHDRTAYDLSFSGFPEPVVRLGKEHLPVEFAGAWDRTTSSVLSPSPLIFNGTGVLKVINPHDDPVRAYLVFTAYRSMSEPVIRYRYRRCVEESDRYLDRLLNGLSAKGCLENTLIVFAADHGEGLGEHDIMGHAHGLYSHECRIPFLVRGPGIRAGTHDLTVSLVDLTPTLLELLEMDVPPQMSGFSFASVLRGKGSHEDLPAFSASYPPESGDLLLGMRDREWSYVRMGEEEHLFRIPEEDPNWDDDHDVSDEHPDVLARLAGRVDEFFDSLEEVRESATRGTVSEKDAQMLRALGYLHGRDERMKPGKEDPARQEPNASGGAVSSPTAEKDGLGYESPAENRPAVDGVEDIPQ